MLTERFAVAHCVFGGALVLGACTSEGIVLRHGPPNSQYEACGVCFASPMTGLSLVRGIRVDSCAFMFRGEGITVDGEHGAFVGKPELGEEAGYQQEAIAGSGLRIRYQYSGKHVDGVWLPGTEKHPPLVFWVEYGSPKFRAAAEAIVGTVRRCS